MLDAKQMPPRMFNLEGTFMGFVGGDDRKPKSIILEVEQEPIVIKLPKELRPYAKSSLKVGDRLQCIGSSQVDFKEGVIKLKAYQVFFLSSGADSASTPSSSLEEIISQPVDSKPCVQETCQPTRSKILVCRKSGCQKRGGRRMIESLERILQTYQLQDQVEICYTGCQKQCSKAPTLTVMPGKHRYERVSAKDLTALIEEHFYPTHPSCSDS